MPPLVFTPLSLPQILNGAWGVDTDVPTAVNTNDGETARLYHHNTGGGTSSAAGTSAIPIPDDVGSVVIHFWAKKYGTPSAGNTIRFGVQTSNGEIHWGTTYQQNDVADATDYVEYVTVVDCTTPGVPSGGSNRIYWEGVGNGQDTYWLCTYVTAQQSIMFDIFSSAGTGGAISPSGTTSVNSGANQAYAITPNAGYQILDVLVDGVSVGPVASYTFVNVTTGHSIVAVFAPVYLLVPVLDVEPDRLGGSDDVFNRRLSEMNNQTGIRVVDVADDTDSLTRAFQWTGTDRTEALLRRRFFSNRAGRLSSFWLPTWEQDLRLASNYSSGAGTIVVAFAGYSALAFPGGPWRRHLQLRGDSRTWYRRKVTNAVDNGNGTETLTLDSSVPENMTAPGFVSFLRLCRFDQDETTVEWSGERYSRASMPARELPKEVP